MAGLTLPVLRQWQPSVLGTAGEAVTTASATVDQHLLAMNRSMDKAQEGWRGDTADAAMARTERVYTAGNRTSTALLGLSSVLTSAAAGLQAAKDDVLALVGAAVDQGYLVFDDGRVQAPAMPALPPGTSPAAADNAAARQEALSSGAQQHATRIGQGLTAAAQADADWATRITTAVDDVQEMANKPVTAGPGSLSPAVENIINGTSSLPSDPQALNDFWEGLTAEEKEALFAHEPGLGNRNGIPAVERDHFNQRHLVDLRETEQDRRDALADEHPDWAAGNPPPAVRNPTPEMRAQYDEYQAWKEQYDATETNLAGYDGVTNAMAGGPNGTPPRYLLGIDGSDRAIISTGNPDTAQNVATMVPGTGSTLSGIGGDVSRADALSRAADLAGSPSTAVVTWYGYDAPPAIPDATDEKYAEAAAGDLDNFQDGLRVTHEGPPSHNTVLGHSYGTTVVGTAATGDYSINADDVVFVASPGTMTDNVSELRLDGVESGDNGQHVYATKAQYDPVPLYTMTGDFGRDPAGYGYGAHNFESASGGAGPAWALGWNVDAHSAYWDPGNPSLSNMGEIVAGNGSSVQ